MYGCLEFSFLCRTLAHRYMAQPSWVAALSAESVCTFADVLLATSPPSFRRRSLLGGYKAHSEAVQESRRVNNDAAAEPQPQKPADEEDVSTANPRKRSRSQNSVRKSRRLSEAPRESERMPGAELAGAGLGQAAGSGGGARGGGGLARCQRVWKMVPPIKDTRPTWLRQYEVRDGVSAGGTLGCRRPFCQPSHGRSYF